MQQEQRQRRRSKKRHDNVLRTNSLPALEAVPGGFEPEDEVVEGRLVGRVPALQSIERRSSGYDSTGFDADTWL